MIFKDGQPTEQMSQLNIEKEQKLFSSCLQRVMKYFGHVARRDTNPFLFLIAFYEAGKLKVLLWDWNHEVQDYASTIISLKPSFIESSF